MISYRDTVKFIPPITRGTVVKVYDGDSITVASRLPHHDSPLYRFPVRINGIDCPEIRSKSKVEKRCAKAARDFLASMVFQKDVSLSVLDMDKYGRMLADVYVQDSDSTEIEVNVADILIKNRMAIPYFGGRKQKVDWENLESN